MRRGFGTTVLLTGVALLLLGAAASRLAVINRCRTELDLELHNPLAESDLASELRLPTVALSIFRSLAIDYLWIRAEALKQEGQYFDALHLARMICTLQPNLASVWQFQAWNMAYNISVAMPTCPERWNWVQAGYELIRDRGLAANPGNLKLYASLCRIFQHKIGAISDECHRYYKERLAYEMMLFFGPGPITNEVLEELAASPRVWRELQKDAGVAALVAAMRYAEPRFGSDEEVLEGLLEFREATLAGILHLDSDRSQFHPDFHQVIADNVQSEALRRLDLFVRARQLRREWKLEPAAMIKINKKYGPIDYENEEEHLSLDWRLPFAHAIYWAVEGLDNSDEQTRRFDRLTLQRALYHGLQDFFHYGNLQIFSVAAPAPAPQRQQGQEVLETQYPAEMRVFLSQDLRMFPVAYQTTLELIKSYRDRGEDTASTVIGSINLARAGVVNLYLAGHVPMARKYYQHLRDRYPENEDYRVSLEEFIRGRMKEEVMQVGPKNAANYINGLLRTAFTRYALGDDENATINEKRAEQVLEYFSSRRDADEQHRVGLGSFSQMRWWAMRDFFGDAYLDGGVKDLLLQRLRVEKPDLFERVIEQLRKERSLSDDSSVSP